MSTLTERILIIEIHKENIEKAKTFEEFKEAQIIYLNWLVQDFKLDKASKDNHIEFAKWQIRE